MQPASVNGPGTGTLTGAIGVFPEPAIFGDGAEPVRCGERFDRTIAVALIVGRGAPAAESRERLEPAEILVEPQVEIDALHFAVGDPVEAGSELVVDRQRGRRRGRPRRDPPARTARGGPSRRR